MNETSKDSGVFVSNIYFSSNHTIGQRLHTIEEDLVIASYEDRTPPLLSSLFLSYLYSNTSTKKNFAK